MIIIAGPCLAESIEILEETASELAKFASREDIDFYFKASYRKANRTSASSYEGPGDEKALSWLAEIKEKYKFKILTDFHSAREAKMAAEVADVLQVPAFLSRQSDIIEAATATGKIVNIKKAQFMAPEDAIKAAAKAESFGAREVWLTERGTSFGYHNLVVDFRSFYDMAASGHKVIYDATHSLQRPSIGEQSGGDRQYLFHLAKAAAASGIDGLFFETHPKPEAAMSDSATQLPLEQAGKLISTVISVNNFVNDL